VPTPQPGVPLAAAPQQSLRVAFKLNDMRSWTPRAPVLLCGGDQDPTVFFENATIMQAYWGAAGLSAPLVNVVDINAAATANDPYAPLQEGFQETEAEIVAAQGQVAAVESYHTTVAPFCTAVARGFFSQFLEPGL